MLLKKLIAELQKLNPEMAVAITDWKQNLAEDDGEGTSAGIYGNFTVSVMQGDDIPDDVKPWVALEFSNDFLNDYGQRLLPYNSEALLEKAKSVYPETPVRADELLGLEWKDYITKLRKAYVKGFTDAFAPEEK